MSLGASESAAWIRGHERVSPRSARSYATNPTPRTEAVSVTQLQRLADEHDATLEALQREIAELESAPSENGARIAYLEHLFSAVGHEDIIRLKSPVLAGIADVIRDEHRILQEEAAHHANVYASFLPAGAESEAQRGETGESGLVLGRGYMPLCQQTVEEIKWRQELKNKRHDTIGDVHYAGNLARPEEEPHNVFMGRGGKHEFRPLPPSPDEGGFWLDVPLEEEQQLQEHRHVDHTAGWKVGGSKSIQGHDDMPVDWLGMARRGISLAMLDDVIKHHEETPR